MSDLYSTKVYRSPEVGGHGEGSLGDGSPAAESRGRAFSGLLGDEALENRGSGRNPAEAKQFLMSDKHQNSPTLCLD